MVPRKSIGFTTMCKPGVSYIEAIFEGRISRVVLADVIFHSPFLHSTATPEVRRCERAAGNRGEALSIFRFRRTAYEAEDQTRTPLAVFFSCSFRFLLSPFR